MSNYLRLRTTPPEGDIPPTGFIDIFYNPSTGAVATRSASGNEVSFLQSTSIPDISTEATPSTIAKRTVAGGLECVTLGATSVVLDTPEGYTASAALGLGVSLLRLIGHASNYIVTFSAGNQVLSADRTLAVPDASGAIAVVPEYVDETAANTALAAGEFYWNQTLKKLKTTTA